MCKTNNMQPKAGLLIKDTESPVIDFTNQFIKDANSVKAVSEAVKRYAFPALAVVFVNNGFRAKESIVIMKSFEHMAPNLKVLNLSQNYLSLQGAQHLSELCTKMRVLKELHLNGCSLGDRGVKVVLEKLDENNIALE